MHKNQLQSLPFPQNMTNHFPWEECAPAHILLDQNPVLENIVKNVLENYL